MLMTLNVDTKSEDYCFNKTLNEDVQLISNRYGKYDLNFQNGDYVNVTGKNSLFNAIVIAIMTRFDELGDIPHYEGFGCKVHELIKARKSEMVEYEMEVSLTEVLENMRRINEVNELIITDCGNQKYKVYFNVTSINDEMVSGEVEI